MCSTLYISFLIENATTIQVRLNHKLMSLVADDFLNIFSLMDTVLFKFQTYAVKPEVCEMDGNCRLRSGLDLLCRV